MKALLEPGVIPGLVILAGLLVIAGIFVWMLIR